MDTKEKSIPVPPMEVFAAFSGAHCRLLWVEIGPAWICPGCNRSKYQVMRWTKRFPGSSSSFMDWIAIVHRHHDHLGRFNRNSGRFPETVICDQCNATDGALKRKLKLPKNFSFSPTELSRIITSTPHGKHVSDAEIALEIYNSVAADYSFYPILGKI